MYTFATAIRKGSACIAEVQIPAEVEALSSPLPFFLNILPSLLFLYFHFFLPLPSRITLFPLS